MDKGLEPGKLASHTAFPGGKIQESEDASARAHHRTVGVEVRFQCDGHARERITLLIDDNHAVLAAAGEFGIRHLLTVVQPDSGRPPRDGLGYSAFNDFREILPDE